MTDKKTPPDDDRDPFADLWPRLMADPEIGLPGSWSIKFYPKTKQYRLFVQMHPGFNAENSPVSYTNEIYREHLAGLFKRIARALERYQQSPGDVPSRDFLKTLFRMDK